jgi:hypothetical protein
MICLSKTRRWAFGMGDGWIGFGTPMLSISLDLHCPFNFERDVYTTGIAIGVGPYDYQANVTRDGCHRWRWHWESRNYMGRSWGTL